LRLIDPRAASPVSSSTVAFEAAKNSKVAWCDGLGGDDHRLVASGFGKMAGRQLSVWDTRKLASPVQRLDVDRQTSFLLLHWDESAGILYASGKGEASIKPYVFTDTGTLNPLPEYRGASPHRCLAFASKKAIDVSKVEIQRVYLGENNTISPMSFSVVRKTTGFHGDLYPPCLAGQPALSADQWKSGAAAGPIRMSLDPDVGDEKRIVSSDNTGGGNTGGDNTGGGNTRKKSVLRCFGWFGGRKWPRLRIVVLRSVRRPGELGGISANGMCVVMPIPPADALTRLQQTIGRMRIVKSNAAWCLLRVQMLAVACSRWTFTSLAGITFWKMCFFNRLHNVVYRRPRPCLVMTNVPGPGGMRKFKLAGATINYTQPFVNSGQTFTVLSVGNEVGITVALDEFVDADKFKMCFECALEELMLLQHC